jgi:uncharacterized membrane protein YqgA involved in biofilm formation
MFGNNVNAIVIIIGSFIGLLLKNGLKERFKSIVINGVGLAVIFIGATSTIGGLLDENSEPILFIISLVIGGIIGEWIGIEKRLNQLGEFIQGKFKSEGGNIAQGFVAASLLFCIGTMAILGALDSGLKGNHDILLAKSVLDGVMAIILTSTMGIGVIFSAFIVFLYQGIIVLFAGIVEPYLTADIIREMSIVGGILIFSLGLDLLEIKKIKTGNYLPAIFIPVIYYLVILPIFS